MRVKEKHVHHIDAICAQWDELRKLGYADADIEAAIHDKSEKRRKMLRRFSNQAETELWAFFEVATRMPPMSQREAALTAAKACGWAYSDTRIAELYRKVRDTRLKDGSPLLPHLKMGLKVLRAGGKLEAKPRRVRDK